MKTIHFVFTIAASIFFAHTSVFSQNWSIGGNSVTTNANLGTNTNYALIFETNNVERGRINNAGNWGVGSTAPGAKLHVNALLGTHPFIASVGNSPKFIINNNGRVGIATNAPETVLHVVGNEILSTGSFAGFRFRNRGATSAADDWIWYSNGNIARLFRAGKGDLLGINKSGQIGFGTLTPEPFTFRVKHGSHGMALESALFGSTWELLSAKNLFLFHDGVHKGTFSLTTGAYSAASDERLKTNIKEMPSVLQKVNELKPRTYRFKDAAKPDTTSTMGFIAQDVLKVFPSLVTHTVMEERGQEFYSLDYSGFGVIAIKAIQEQQNAIKELQNTNDKQLQKIEILENRLAKIESALVNMNSGVNKSLEGAYLDQNYPNPFSDVTTFNYSIPMGANAQMVIYDLASGEMVKSVQVNDSGKFQISASELKPGIYNCTLIVNGEVVGSRKMMLNK